jgi:hypothetical protein
MKKKHVNENESPGMQWNSELDFEDFRTSFGRS